MYTFAIIILALSLAFTFVDAVDSREPDPFKIATSALSILAFAYIINL